MSAASEPDFDWLRDESIVAHHQPATAIYLNSGDNIVIRQERTWDQEEDSFVHFARSNLASFIEALQRYLPSPKPVGLISHQPVRRATAQGNLLREAAE